MSAPLLIYLNQLQGNLVFYSRKRNLRCVEEYLLVVVALLIASDANEPFGYKSPRFFKFMTFSQKGSDSSLLLLLLPLKLRLSRSLFCNPDSSKSVLLLARRHLASRSLLVLVFSEKVNEGTEI